MFFSGPPAAEDDQAGTDSAHGCVRAAFECTRGWHLSDLAHGLLKRSLCRVPEETSVAATVDDRSDDVKDFVSALEAVDDVPSAVALIGRHLAGAGGRPAADGTTAAEAWKRSGDEHYARWRDGERRPRRPGGGVGRKDGAGPLPLPTEAERRRQDLHRAVQAYTEALCCSGRRRGGLDALLYANRALALHQLGDYRRAIVDCDRALTSGYPEDRLFKVLHRRGSCHVGLGQDGLALDDLRRALQHVDDGLDRDPSLASTKAQLLKEIEVAQKRCSRAQPKPEANARLPMGPEEHERESPPAPTTRDKGMAHRLPHASDAVTMARDEVRGRYIVAVREIKAGEALLHEQPYAAVLLRPHEKTHCHYCFTAEEALIPCLECSWARYCSEQCRSAAAAIHKYECGEVFFQVAPTLLVLCMRIMRRRMIAREESDKDYEIVQSLMTHVDDLLRETLAEYARLCVIAQIYVDTRTQTMKEGDGQGDDRGRWMDAWLLLRHLCQTHTNVYAICEILDSADESGGGVQQRRVAEAMYATASLFNHSCCPNTVLNYEGRVLTIRASQDIGEGSEVFNCYGPDVAHMPSREERLQALRQQYCFECTCAACASTGGTTNCDYLVCGAEGCTCELTINPEAIQRGIFTVRCGRGHGTDIRDVQREIKLARGFFERARQVLDEPSQHNPDRAVQALSHALRLRARYLHPLHREIGRTHDALAEAHACLGNYKAAAGHLERAVAALETVFPAFSFELADQYFKLAQLWFNARADPDKVDRWAEKAKRVWNILIGARASGPAGSSTHELAIGTRGRSQVSRGQAMIAELARMQREARQK